MRKINAHWHILATIYEEMVALKNSYLEVSVISAGGL